jgi:uncharacterized delta-60 repeat protein
MALSSRIAALAFPVLLFGFLALPSPALGAGVLDPSFDGDGKVVTDLGGVDIPNDVAIQADGKIVAAGPGGVNAGDSTLVRFNVDGSLDDAFDGDGKVVTGFFVSGVAIQSDGKIVVSGAGEIGFALARYNPDGSLDTTFDGDGRVETDFGPDAVASRVIITGGKIVAAGMAYDDFALARYDTDGSLDTTFGGDGKVETDFGASDWVEGMTIQADGKIVAAGASFFTCGCPDFADSQSFVLARYNDDGSLDADFDGDGRVFTAFGDQLQAALGVVLQADGKIVAVGGVCGCGGPGDPPSTDFALARYNGDGSLDPSFDGDGKVLTNFGAEDYGSDLAIQADGKLVAVGRTVSTSVQDFAIARYNPDGSLDPNFDFDGRVTTDFGAAERASAVAIGPGGKIVAAGDRNVGSNYDFALARYTATGTTLPTISINDIMKLEGNAGLTAFTFTVSLSSPSSQTITVSRQTANGTASAPADYTTLNSATITFPPGQTTKTVTVKVKGELAIEPNETFFVNLSNPVGATIADGQGKGTIQNDDLSESAACTILGTSHSDVINGTSGNDVICGGRGDDEIHGLGGNDVLKGEDGNDLLLGGNGYDLLVGAGGRDDIRGETGNDTLRGGDQDDTLNGAAGSDALFGDAGGDSLNAQDGVTANDSADGGADGDSCVFDSGDFVTSCP